MPAFLTRQETHTRRGKGTGLLYPFSITGASTGTAASIASGGLTVFLVPNTIGTTFPSTIVGMSFPPSPAIGFNPIWSMGNSLIARGFSLGRIYRLGTLNLAATGNQFTPDGAVTYPLLRKEFTEASKAISLIPLLQVTTALSTTAAILRLRNNTGPGNGYVNQDGTGKTGTVDFTFPSVTTAVNSAYIPMLESGDSGVQSISQIDVTTASASGAATVWGLELFFPMNTPVAALGYCFDSLISGFLAPDLSPAVPTAGTVTSHLIGISWVVSNNTVSGVLEGVGNT